MKKADFVTRYRAEMADVHVSPQLKRSTLDALEGKEKPIMKKKLSAALVLMIAIFLFGAAALAAANHAGILDFAGFYGNSHVPADAQDYIDTDVASMENELATVQLRELYYDGCIVRMTVDVFSNNDSIMLLGFDGLDAPWSNMSLAYRANGEADEADARTVLDVYKEGGYQSAYAVTVDFRLEEETLGGSEDYCINEDGSLTYYIQMEFMDSKPQRSAMLRLSLMPYAQPLTLDSAFLPDERVVLDAPITLEQASYADESYISLEGKDYPSAGVRVDEIRLEVRAQEIHASIEYTVIDQEAYDALDDGLWFEFIDPASTADAPAAQRLDEGLTHTGNVSSLGGGRYCQTESLGRNELHDTYTLRAYECWEKQRFETRTFQMRKVDDLP